VTQTMMENIFQTLIKKYESFPRKFELSLLLIAFIEILLFIFTWSSNSLVRGPYFFSILLTITMMVSFKIVPIIYTIDPVHYEKSKQGLVLLLSLILIWMISITIIPLFGFIMTPLFYYYYANHTGKMIKS